MIDSKRIRPLRLRKTEALLRRISDTNPKYDRVEEKLKIRASGYRGEQSLDYYVSFLDKKKYQILHGLRLQDAANDHYFEIDTLIITPSLIIPIDAKNHKGELHFDEQFDQLIQTYEGQKTSYDSPLAQITRHEFQLKSLLQLYKFPTVPIEPLVVITNPSTIVTASQNHKQIHKIIKSLSLITKIGNIEKRFKVEVFDHKQIQKLTKLLLKLNTPYDNSILEEFDLHEDDILKGVHCPKCGTLPMKRLPRKWECTSCGHSDKDAHIAAIEDYVLLFGNTITNQKLREFLNLPSRSAATRILKSLNFQFTGENKGRIYKISI
ncbi:nuclease-related domain-containing protein [Fredinandcohnia quinoae]|uniref:NERD domain-containing protein n=1 Tax=Fredinandcohnia quinoae TaxID=2918902 RepID=A0AAW5ED69_9BACI|nr:nuclease-related domain-containing protein [Fredinandcohnia sp. SECRCQ15]MCH1627847.1 NERD domain-containing protein [Fredinandcohnia sp. SECRCQ15]